MTETAISYLSDYRGLLDKVKSHSDIFEEVLNWQFLEHEPHGRGVQAHVALTEALLSKKAWKELKLAATDLEAPVHLPTTALGSFSSKGFILIAANPHFSATRNLIEMDFRRPCALHNRHFCENVFSE